MTRYLFLTTASVFCFLLSRSQPSQSKKREDFDINKFKTRTIEIPLPRQVVSLNNISMVRVVDARPDTTHIGLFKNKARTPVFISLRNGVTNEVQRFYNGYLSCNKNAEIELIAVLRNLWFSEKMETASEYEDNITSEKHRDSTAILIQIDFYLKKINDYFAAYRSDTIVYQVWTESDPQLFREALMASCSRLSGIDPALPGYISKKRKLTWEEITRYNESKFDIPILKDTAHPRGVYVTYDEFRNNTPSITDFEIKKDKLIDIVYVRQQDGTFAANRKIWGFSDGKDLYVRFHDNFYLLQRLERSYYIYASRKPDETVQTDRDLITPWSPYSATSPYGSPFGPTGSYSDKMVYKFSPYRLNWDSGKFF